MPRIVLIVAIVAATFVAAGYMVLRSSRGAGVPPTETSTPAPVESAPPAAEAPGENTAAEPSPSRAPAARPASGAARKTPSASTPEPEAPAAPTTATLRIDSDVPGAQVFLNREFVGATPTVATGLAPGTYQLNVAAPGYENHVDTLEVTPGDRDVMITFRVVRLDASLDVIHKHRFGSCRGRLVATAHGLRYETTHKEDGFQAALLDLETFEVDYLDKNLRIQPRRGRRYDFTDPDGDADRLFVFHRDVDRARERLRQGDVPASY